MPDYNQDLVFDPQHMTDEGFSTQQSRDAPTAYHGIIQEPPTRQPAELKPIEVCNVPRAAKHFFGSGVNVSATAASKIVSSHAGRAWITLWAPTAETIYIANDVALLEAPLVQGFLLPPNGMPVTFYTEDALYAIAPAGATLVYYAVGEN